MTALRSVSIERADALQVATCDAVWQFRIERGSVFRLEAVFQRWRGRVVAPAEAARGGPCRK